MSAFSAYLILCLGVFFIICSLGFYFPNSDLNHKYKVNFNKHPIINIQAEPFVINGKNICTLLLLIGLIIIFFSLILIWNAADVFVMFNYDIKIALLLILPLVFVFLLIIYHLNKYYKKIYIYVDRIIVKSFLKTKRVLISNFDCIELVYRYKDTYIFSSYIFSKKGKKILKLRSNAYKNLNIIEEIFIQNDM